MKGLESSWFIHKDKMRRMKGVKARLHSVQHCLYEMLELPARAWTKTTVGGSDIHKMGDAIRSRVT